MDDSSIVIPVHTSNKALSFFLKEKKKFYRKARARLEMRKLVLRDPH